MRRRLGGLGRGVCFVLSFCCRLPMSTLPGLPVPPAEPARGESVSAPAGGLPREMS